MPSDGLQVVQAPSQITRSIIINSHALLSLFSFLYILGIVCAFCSCFPCSEVSSCFPSNAYVLVAVFIIPYQGRQSLTEDRDTSITYDRPINLVDICGEAQKALSIEIEA